MMGVLPKMFFLSTQADQLVGSPPEFCHTEMAVPTINGAFAAGADDIAIWEARLLRVSMLTGRAGGAAH